MEKILLAKQVGEWLGLDVQRIYELTPRNLLPHIKIGDRQYRYSEREITEWLKKGGNQSNETECN